MKPTFNTEYINCMATFTLFRGRYNSVARFFMHFLERLTPLEIIRMRHHLTSRKNITNALPAWWVKQVRELFELRYETWQLERTEKDDIVCVNGYFSLIDPGAYVEDSTELLWQSFIRGAIAQKIIDNSGFSRHNDTAKGAVEKIL